MQKIRNAWLDTQAVILQHRIQPLYWLITDHRSPAWEKRSMIFTEPIVATVAMKLLMAGPQSLTDGPGQKQNWLSMREWSGPSK